MNRNKDNIKGLPWKTALAFISILLLQALAIILGFYLKSNRVGLVITLVFLHAAEFLSLLFLFFGVALLSKKDKRLSFLPVLLVVFLLLIVISCALEAYLIKA